MKINYVVKYNSLTCRYSPDESLLKLQKIAKENHLGCIWSGVKKNILLGAKQHDFSSTDEAIKHLGPFEYTAIENMGFPLSLLDQTGRPVIRLQPWYERQCKSELEHATRSQYRSHMQRLTELPYGFVIDMHAERYINNKIYFIS